MKSDPNYAMAYNNRGIVKAALGDIAGAIADFNQAIKINDEVRQRQMDEWAEANSRNS